MSDLRFQSTPASQPAPAYGQLWRRVHTQRVRLVRHVRVIGLSKPAGKLVFLRRCEPNGDLPKNSRISSAMREEFNGQIGGFEFVKELRP